MNSMPEPSTPRTIDTRLPGTVAELRAAAVTALQSWSTVDSPEQAARLLESWKRRGEMTDEDVAVVLDAMFPEPTNTSCFDTDPHIDATVERWNEQQREWYAEGFLDAIATKLKVSGEARAAVESVVARRDDLGEVELSAIRAALAEPCDDGGFADDFLERQRLAIQAARNDEPAGTEHAGDPA